MTDFANFYHALSEWGLENAAYKYYGLYPCRVERNDDEEARGRIQISNPIIGEGETIDEWVIPCFPGAGDNRGMFWPPEIGDYVFCSFTRGEPDRPEIYLGGWYASGELPSEFKYTDGLAEFGVPERRGFVSRKGHRLLFSDEEGKESVRLLWHKSDSDPDRAQSTARKPGKHSGIRMEADGSVIINNQNGATLELNATDATLLILDDNGNSITLKDKTITIMNNANPADSIVLKDGVVTILSTKAVTIATPSVSLDAGGVALAHGADSPAMRHREWELWAKTHTHPTGTGPSGPPIVPPPPTIASSNVKLK